MTIDELKRNYSEDDLSHFMGDNELRYRLFSPFFSNLHENKVVYRERFVCLVRLENIEITPEGFSSTAVPLIHIEFTGDWRPEPPPEPWEFGAVWKAMCVWNNGFSAPYASWTIWPDPELVREVERLALKGEFERALELTAWVSRKSIGE